MAYPGRTETHAVRPPGATGILWPVTSEQTSTVIPTTADGRPDPEAIKGKMTLQEIITTYHIPQAGLYDALQLPADLPTSTQAKALKELVPGFEMELMRQAVRDYYADHP